MEEYVTKYSTPGSTTTVNGLCAFIEEQAVGFERDYLSENRWFRSQPVHEFEGFVCKERATGKVSIRQAFKILKEDQTTLILANEEVTLPEEYYVARVIEESTFKEYVEYADLKFRIDRINNTPPPDAG